MKRTLYGTVSQIEHSTYRDKNGVAVPVNKFRIEWRTPFWGHIELDPAFADAPAIGTTFRIDITELREKED